MQLPNTAELLIEAHKLAKSKNLAIESKLRETEFRGHALRIPFGEASTGREEELGEGSSARNKFRRAKATEDYDVAHMYAGQTVGLLETIRPAATIVGDIETQAQRLLEATAASVARERQGAQEDPCDAYRAARPELERLWEQQAEGKPAAAPPTTGEGARAEQT